jgi:hypothetical protein
LVRSPNYKLSGSKILYTGKRVYIKNDLALPTASGICYLKQINDRDDKVFQTDQEKKKQFRPYIISQYYQIITFEQGLNFCYLTFEERSISIYSLVLICKQKLSLAC